VPDELPELAAYSAALADFQAALTVAERAQVLEQESLAGRLADPRDLEAQVRHLRATRAAEQATDALATRRAAAQAAQVAVDRAILEQHRRHLEYVTRRARELACPPGPSAHN
jgi:hypothetical protein